MKQAFLIDNLPHRPSSLSTLAARLWKWARGPARRRQRQDRWGFALPVAAVYPFERGQRHQQAGRLRGQVQLQPIRRLSERQPRLGASVESRGLYLRLWWPRWGKSPARVAGSRRVQGGRNVSICSHLWLLTMACQSHFAGSRLCTCIERNGGDSACFPRTQLQLSLSDLHLQSKDHKPSFLHVPLQWWKYEKNFTLRCRCMWTSFILWQLLSWKCLKILCMVSLILRFVNWLPRLQTRQLTAGRQSFFVRDSFYLKLWV